MNASDDRNLDELSDREFDSVDAVCDRFEQAWRSGDRLSIESLLDTCDPQLRSVMLVELVRQECELLAADGTKASREKYVERFPNSVETLDRLWQDLDNNDTAQPMTTANEVANDFVPLPANFGRYRIEREIGRGGMAAVYLAVDTQLGRKVAIKAPYLLSREGPAAIDRFYREARAMATVRHPALCPVYDVGQIDGRYFLTMAYLEGQTLAERLATGEPWPPEKAVSLVKSLCDAVQHAHDAGIVHRDLKPANIMLDKSDQPVIMDFGLVRGEFDGDPVVTLSRVICGSPGYMAPEQVDHQAELIGPRTDVYALGVILYELLAGRRPFDGPLGRVLAKISTGTYKPLREQSAAVPTELDGICRRAMATDPAQRFATAADFGKALAGFLNQPPKIESEKQTRSIGGVILAVLAVLGVVYAVSRMGPAHQPVQVANKTVTPIAETKPPEWKWLPPENLGPIVNSPDYESHPFLSHDGLTLLFESSRPGGFGAHDLWQSTRTSLDEEWHPPENLGPGVNTDGYDVNPAISRDELTLFFARKETDADSFDIWMSTRASVTDAWGDSIRLEGPINSEANDGGPCPSADGLRLYFHSNRPGLGEDDLWVATRATTADVFGNVAPLEHGLNTPLTDAAARISADDRTLVWHTNREETAGGNFDLWFASRADAAKPFDRPRSIGATINSPALELAPCLSADGRVLFFESDREGGQGASDLWMSRQIDNSER